MKHQSLKIQLKIYFILGRFCFSDIVDGSGGGVCVWESDRVAFTFKEDHFICWRSWVEGDGANIRKLISNNN